VGTRRGCVCFGESSRLLFLVLLDLTLGVGTGGPRGRCVRMMSRGLELCVLEVVNTRSLPDFLVLGLNPFQKSASIDFRMTTTLWDLSLGRRTGDGKFDGTFWGGLWMVFSWGGRGRGRGTQGDTLKFVFTGRLEVPNSPFYDIYYLLNTFRTSRKCPRCSKPWSDTCTVQVSTP
jgi:hypothetical protein